MRAFAFPVTTNLSQPGEGVWLLDVVISTWSPIDELRCSGETIRPFTLAPPSCRRGGVDGRRRSRPASAPRGSEMRSPPGVKQKDLILV